MSINLKALPIWLALSGVTLSFSAAALPPYMQRDAYSQQLASLLTQGQYADAKHVLAKYDQLMADNPKLRQPIEYYYFRAQVALNTSNPAQALQDIDTYLSKVGSRGTYYKEGLAIYGEAEMALEQQQRQLSAQTYLDDLLKSLKMNVVDIPAGAFKMGCSVRDMQCDPDEKPAHQVQIDYQFKMMNHEVTFAQWDMCVAEGGCSYKPYDSGWGRDDRPVINVSWQDTKQFIQWLNKKSGLTFRLPSEAEWEYAARAGSDLRYAWGHDLSCDQALFGYWSNECGHKATTHPVATYSSNAWGLFDMHGNVLEWTADCWDPEAYQHPEHAQHGQAWRAGDCDRPVVRGGSWNNSSAILRASNRAGYELDYRYNYLGFRLVLEQPELTQLTGL